MTAVHSGPGTLRDALRRPGELQKAGAPDEEQSPPVVSLNPNQKRALDVQIQQLEGTLLDLRQKLREPVQDGRLVRHKPITEEVRAHVEAALEQMQEEIEVIAREFRLEPSVEDLGSQIVAEMSVAWANLEDTLSPKLSRYGPVDPALSETLDPHIRVLIELALDMVRAASGGLPQEKDKT